MSDVLQEPESHYDPRGRLDPAGFSRNVSFRTIPPPEALAPFVEHSWVIRWDGVADAYHNNEVMHRPYVDLFVSASESGIQGTFRGRRTYVAAGSGRIIGKRFRPGGFRAFWPRKMADLQDEIAALSHVFPDVDEAYIRELLEQDDDAVISAIDDLLLSKSPRADPNVDLVNEIVTAIEAEDGPDTVEALAQKLDRSERWLQQLFREYVGIGPKWLIQRRRLPAAAREIRAIARPNWAAIAYDLGYSSQQHFITDFRQVLGTTPVGYKRDLEIRQPGDA
ncbi:MAG: helix-turn-helix domain-containing protein [Candidatus Limnocylindrales bacterium]